MVLTTEEIEILETVSRKVNRGEPVSFIDAVSVIEYWRIKKEIAAKHKRIRTACHRIKWHIRKFTAGNGATQTKEV
jgi:hypothetical protein